MRHIRQLIPLTLILCMILSGCGKRYNEDDYIGKRSDEIISEFGDFDFATGNSDDQGLYRNCQCGYTIKEKHAGLLESSEEILLFIRFDENGIATECEEGYRPGG